MPPPHHLLESITIPTGYLRNTHLSFSPHLNCIIGGRGSGKTTLIELLRFALAAPLPAASIPAHEALVKGTLADGRVSVAVRTQHGIRYEASRAVGQAPRVTTESGEVANVSLDGELFKVEIYGQNQIESIATDSDAQLVLIDRFVEADARRLAESMAETQRVLDENAAALLRLAREIEDDEERTRELPSIDEALKGLRHLNGPDAAVARRAFEHKALRARERAALSQSAIDISGLDAALTAFAKSAQDRLASGADAEIERGPNGALFTSLSSDLRASAAGLDEATHLVRARIAESADRIAIARRALDATHETEDAAFAVFLEAHHEDQGRIAERSRLEQRHLDLTLTARRLESRRRDYAARKGERKALLERLFALRHERFLARQRVCRDLSLALEGEVRVSIQEAADAAPYEALLAEVLRGANVRPASFAAEIARLVKPEDLAVMALENDVARLMDIDDAKTGKRERAQRILDAIRASGRVYEIETALIGDIPLIELRAGAVYKRSAEVSMGQRCTCILPILLLRSASPLLIDQPEDNLDNAFIYDFLVKAVTLTKRARQLIFVTHNPNLPVLGDAERVFVLASDGDHGAVAEVGSVEELRAPIERLLEGGSEAFLRRGARYGHGSGA